MSATGHVEALKSRHQELDHLLSQERRRPRPDDDQIAQIKRKKLEIKDELHRLQALH